MWGGAETVDSDSESTVESSDDEAGDGVGEVCLGSFMVLVDVRPCALAEVILLTPSRVNKS